MPLAAGRDSTGRSALRVSRERSRVTAHQILQRAELLLESRNLAHAVAAFDHAELLGASADRCSAGRWLAAMLRGDFPAAWSESDAIRQRGAPDPNRFWQGEDICGKRVMLRCLHGFGDAVQFLRYAPQLRLLASKLTVQLPPAMLEIAPYFEGVREVITWGQDPKWDVQMEIIELPYVFRTRLEDLPIATNLPELPAVIVDKFEVVIANSDAEPAELTGCFLIAG